MFGAEKGNLDSSDSRLNGKKLVIGIVQARFNESITDALAKACTQELMARGRALLLKTPSHTARVAALAHELAARATDAGA